MRRRVHNSNIFWGFFRFKDEIILHNAQTKDETQLKLAIGQDIKGPLGFRRNLLQNLARLYLESLKPGFHTKALI